EDPSWILVNPSTPSDALPTLQPVATVTTTAQDLNLVGGSTLDLIFLALTAHPARDPALAQIVAQFVEPGTLQPLAGVTVTFPGAEAIGYANAQSWTDAPGSRTDNTGLVVLANVPVGSSANLALGGVIATTVSVDVRAGAVTLAPLAV